MGGILIRASVVTAPSSQETAALVASILDRKKPLAKNVGLSRKQDHAVLVVKLGVPHSVCMLKHR